MTKSFQVVGIGNAIIDILAYVSDEFLAKNQIKKGVMNLINSERSKELFRQISVTKKIAGGSAANTIVGLSQLGIKTSYIGKVYDDEFGKFFTDDLNSNNVEYGVSDKFDSSNFSTGHCIVLVTPDGERTMNTYLGVTEFLSKDDLNLNILQNSGWLYLEGYRYDGVDSQKAFEIAIDHSKKGGGKVALSLSDPFCVKRHRAKFIKIINNGVDLVFCNEKELISLTEQTDLHAALKSSSDFPCKFICTVAERGVYIKHKGSWINISTNNVKIKDTTGAGDLFATGFLYGILSGNEDPVSCEFANKCAGEVIRILGCRLDKQHLLDLV
ncbi:MAG: adenosine kinase [Paracoccaceae bacterium]